MKKRHILNVNDNHKLLWDWEDFKDVIGQADEDLLKFFGPKKTKKAGVRARKKVIKMIRMLYGIRKKLLMQRQDYDSEY